MATHDPEFYNAPKYAPETPPVVAKQHGCFFYGCIIASILAVLFLILVGVIGYFSYRFATRMVEQYTSTSPREIPTVEMPEADREALKKRFEDFRKAVNEGTPTDTLVLTSDDINALIEDDADLKGKVHVKIEGDEVKAEISIPLEKIGLAMLRGRYLNGEADVKASLVNGVLIVTLDSVEVNGKPFPEEFMQPLREQNLAKDMYKDQKNAEMLRRLEKLEIKDGKIILRVRAKAGAPAGKASENTKVPVKVTAPPAANEAKPAPQPAQPAAPKSDTPKTSALGSPAQVHGWGTPDVVPTATASIA